MPSIGATCGGSDSKLLLMCSIKPHLHADGAVPGGRLLVVVGVVEGDEVKKDFAAMSGLAALGGFVMRQWMNYERRSLKYRASGTGQSGVTGPETQAFVIANVSCLKATAEDCKGRGLTEVGLPEPQNENAPGSCSWCNGSRAATVTAIVT